MNYSFVYYFFICLHLLFIQRTLETQLEWANLNAIYGICHTPVRSCSDNVVHHV